jgi:hypothetical protein
MFQYDTDIHHIFWVKERLQYVTNKGFINNQRILKNTSEPGFGHITI